MPGQKSGSGSDKKPSGSKFKGSSDKKGKAPVQNSTQGESSHQNRSAQNGESSSHTQSTTSDANITQTASDQWDYINCWMEFDSPWVPGDRREDHNEEEPPKETFYSPNLELSDEEAEAVARKDGKR
ncbi:hypothetical protein FGRMN_1637 [Fusarium graminum]|nr:hypothetical protein FGRMN_1637 [Fusarium graminum]